MVLQEFLDGIPLLVYLLFTIIIMILPIEIGYRGGKFNRGKPDKAQMAQVRAIMGASLGLLAFMLAFSFAVAQKHFEERTNAYLLEVTAIDAAFRGASLLSPEAGNEARQILRQFVQLRRDTSDAEDRDELEEVVMLIRAAARRWSVAPTEGPGWQTDWSSG